MSDYTVLLSFVAMMNAADPLSMGHNARNTIAVHTTCNRVGLGIECLATMPVKISGNDMEFHDQVRCAILLTPMGRGSVASPDARPTGAFSPDDARPTGLISDLTFRAVKTIIFSTLPQTNDIMVRSDAEPGITTVTYRIPAEEIGYQLGCQP